MLEEFQSIFSQIYFEPFISSKFHGGMGLGLNVARTIVELHHGTIKAYNHENGAVFDIVLPKIVEE